jgi:hypothetical protein
MYRDLFAFGSALDKGACKELESVICPHAGKALGCILAFWPAVQPTYPVIGRERVPYPTHPHHSARLLIARRRPSRCPLLLQAPASALAAYSLYSAYQKAIPVAVVVLWARLGTPVQPLG